MKPIVPQQSIALVTPDGRATRPFYDFLLAITRRSGGVGGFTEGGLLVGTDEGDPEEVVISSGDVTFSSGLLTIANNAVTFAKFQDISTNKLLGRASGGTGDVEQIDLTAAGRDLLDDANNTEQRTTLGLGTAAVKNVNAMGDLTVDHLTFNDGKNIVANSATGTKVGTATTQKLGFWNATPIVQPASADQAATTPGNTNGAIGGLTIGAAYSQAEVQALRNATETLADDFRADHTLLIAVRLALVNAGIMKGSA